MCGYTDPDCAYFNDYGMQCIRPVGDTDEPSGYQLDLGLNAESKSMCFKLGTDLHEPNVLMILTTEAL